MISVLFSITQMYGMVHYVMYLYYSKIARISLKQLHHIFLNLVYLQNFFSLSFSTSFSIILYSVLIIWKNFGLLPNYTLTHQ